MNRSGLNVRKSFLRTARAWPVLLAAVLLLAGCGNDDIAALPESQGGGICPGTAHSRITVNGQDYISTFVDAKDHACDPLAIAAFDSSSSPKVTFLVGLKKWVKSFDSYDHVIRFIVGGPIPGSLPETYPLGSSFPTAPGESVLFWDLNQSGTSGTPTFCGSTTGNLTIDGYGPERGYISGSFNATVAGDAGCPTGASGTFAVMRVNINYNPP